MNAMHMDEQDLKDTIFQMQTALKRICLCRGHDFETTRRARKEQSGGHMETYRLKDHYEDCFHNCHCPEVEKTRFVPDYIVVRTTIETCKRCGETTTREAKEPYNKWSGL